MYNDDMEDIKSKKEDKKLRNYINNDEFLVAMNAWKKDVNKAKREKKGIPPVTDYIGICFFKIAEHLSHRPNFINYPFREDMISDGVENCLQYAHNFDSKKSKNPFSYFTQIIYYAFLRRIEKEKKQAYIKYRCLEENNIDSKFVEWLKENGEGATFSEFLQKNFSLTETDLEKMEKLTKKKKKKKK
jgi:hypothetical protein